MTNKVELISEIGRAGKGIQIIYLSIKNQNFTETNTYISTRCSPVFTVNCVHHMPWQIWETCTSVHYLNSDARLN